jgi:hypothetical protein
MQAAEETQPQAQPQTLLRCTQQVQRDNSHERTSRAVEVHRRNGGKSEIKIEVRERKHSVFIRNLTQFENFSRTPNITLHKIMRSPHDERS